MEPAEVVYTWRTIKVPDPLHSGQYLGSFSILHYALCLGSGYDRFGNATPNAIAEYPTPGVAIREDSLNDYISTTASQDCISFWDAVGQTYVDDSAPSPFSRDEAVLRARGRIATHENAYDVFLNNCEHFVNWCKYGNQYSWQAAVALTVFPDLALDAAIKGWTKFPKLEELNRTNFSGTGSHMYSNNPTEFPTSSGGYTYEGVIGQGYADNQAYDNSTSFNLVPLYRKDNWQWNWSWAQWLPYDCLLTMNYNEASWFQDKGTIAYISPTYGGPLGMTQTLYRLFNGSHLFTTSGAEYSSLVNSGWTFEGIVGYTW